MALVRHPSNPVLSAKDIPFDASLIFNAGVCKFNGRYVMVFRNDVGFGPNGYGKTYTNLGIAYSDDGVKWEVQPRPWKVAADIVAADPELSRFYDPRLTVIDGRCYLCFAVDTMHGVRGGIAVTDDFDHFEVLSMSAPDNRNMVLFPEKFDGKFVRLERPFPEYSRGYQEKFDIWSSMSPDCRAADQDPERLALHLPRHLQGHEPQSLRLGKRQQSRRHLEQGVLRRSDAARSRRPAESDRPRPRASSQSHRKV